MKKLTAIIVGAGHRGVFYASYAEAHPEELAIVGVAEPDDGRRKRTAERFALAPDACFRSAEELAERPRRADFIINGTMDRHHVPTTLPLLERGYDVLLEKPFATGEDEMWRLVEAARRTGRKVVICHVLRHAPFYAAIREQLGRGAIGDVLNIQAAEHVAFHHMAVAFVRGKWRNRSYCGSAMLMAKSCHDLDLITWFKGGVHPVRVASFGSNFQFRPENAPAGAGTRCLVDCPVEPDCIYSARKHHLDRPGRWAFYVWSDLEHLERPTEEDRLELLTASDYGRCVWKMNMDVVDHQSVLIEFEDGCTATLSMTGGVAKASRAIHLIGTEGEIEGRLEESRFVVRRIAPGPDGDCREEVVDLKVRGDMTGARGGHAGGDMALVADSLRYLRGEPASASTTGIEDSIDGHLIGFCADRAMRAGAVVNVVRREPAPKDGTPATT